MKNNNQAPVNMITATDVPVGTPGEQALNGPRFEYASPAEKAPANPAEVAKRIGMLASYGPELYVPRSPDEQGRRALTGGAEVVPGTEVLKDGTWKVQVKFRDDIKDETGNVIERMGSKYVPLEDVERINANTWTQNVVVPDFNISQEATLVGNYPFQVPDPSTGENRTFQFGVPVDHPDAAGVALQKPGEDAKDYSMFRR